MAIGRLQKVIDIPAEPAEPEQLPPALKPFKAVPPLITDINLSLDDRFLYIACFGTGDLQQWDVSDPFRPKLTGKVRLGGIVSHAPHPKAGALNGGSQMLEVSRDGRRIYLSNSLYGAGMRNSFPRESAGGSLSLMLIQRAGSKSIRSSSCPSRVNAPTRCGSKAATLHRIRTAIHERDCGRGWPSRCSAHTTASIRRWDGCSRWHSDLQESGAARRLSRRCFQ